MATLKSSRFAWSSLRGCMAAHVLSALLLGAGLTAANAQLSADLAAASTVPGPKSSAPHYLSLKADRVHLRKGPGAEYPAVWVFRRTGLPVEVIEANAVWRKVRDAGGAEGWVHGSLLSGRRTALVLPWDVKEGETKASSAMLREDDRESARPIAQVEAGVLASIIACEKGWCRVSVGNYRGFIEQGKLWGTYPNEEINP